MVEKALKSVPDCGTGKRRCTHEHLDHLCILLTAIRMRNLRSVSCRTRESGNGLGLSLIWAPVPVKPATREQNIWLHPSLMGGSSLSAMWGEVTGDLFRTARPVMPVAVVALSESLHTCAFHHLPIALGSSSLHRGLLPDQGRLGNKRLLEY